MTESRPARAGTPIAEVDTPALALDLSAFTRNLERMQAELAGSGVALRAHGKAHKCPDIAKRQIAMGAVGVCCQKVSEAEVFVDAGIDSVLVTNEIVAAAKLARLAGLARRADVMVLCDDASVVPLLGESARAAGTALKVLVEVEVGGKRCGIAPGEEAARLASLIERESGLSFAGLQAYCGSAQHKPDYAERRDMTARVVEAVKTTLSALGEAGLARAYVTGGGTGSYPLERDSGVFTEVQAGSYAFLDTDYARILDEDGAPLQTFEQSLFILSTVVSRPTKNRAVLDAGHKAHSMDSGLAGIAEPPGGRVTGQSDEHMVVALDEGTPGFAIGNQVRLIPGHVDPTFNLHDWLVCMRGDAVEDVWPITARGPGL
jgi:D-serine deaminase-like pyridoxal phosphate-dependent protein